MLTTTLAEILAHEPCDDRFAKLRNHFGVSPSEAKTHDVPFPLTLLLETNGLDDAVWVFEKVAPQRVKDEFLIRRLDTGDHSALKSLRRNPVDADWWHNCEKAILDVTALLRRRMAGEDVEQEMECDAYAAYAAAYAANAAYAAAAAALNAANAADDDAAYYAAYAATCAANAAYYAAYAAYAAANAAADDVANADANAALAALNAANAADYDADDADYDAARAATRDDLIAALNAA